jgi:hypothetical protein
MATGNIRGQRTQSATCGYKTLGSSIASGNNGGAFKRIYINAFQRYNGDSELAYITTLGIPYGLYRNPNQNTPQGKQYPIISDNRYKQFIIPSRNATTVKSGIIGERDTSEKSATAFCNNYECNCCQTSACAFFAYDKCCVTSSKYYCCNCSK